jgi:uroporphyrinogen-III synthase
MTTAASAVRPVVVTREEAQDGPLSTHLRKLGLTVLLWPAVRTSGGDSGALDQALQRVTEFAWIVFASRRAVAAVLERLPTQPTGLRIAAVGKATAQVLRQRGWQVDVVPDQAEAGALVTALVSQLQAGTHVLYPASSRALPTIAKGLAQLGVAVTQVEAYRTESAELDVAECRAWIQRDGIGVITFASPSAVVELAHALGKEDLDRLLGKATAVAIGPTTARALAERGYPAVMAEAATLSGLANTALRALQAQH